MLITSKPCYRFIRQLGERAQIIAAQTKRVRTALVTEKAAAIAAGGGADVTAAFAERPGLEAFLAALDTYSAP